MKFIIILVIQTLLFINLIDFEKMLNIIFNIDKPIRDYISLSNVSILKIKLITTLSLDTLRSTSVKQNL
tara:strand:+ start:1567 stop:1773 length:207 start_codon:yes stop_codon:yes gene_type:complete